MEKEKEIRGVGSAYDDLVGFQDEPRRDAGFQLSKVQAGLEPEDWKPEAVRTYTASSNLATYITRKIPLLSLMRISLVPAPTSSPALLPEEDAGDQQAIQGHCRGAVSRRGQREK